MNINNDTMPLLTKEVGNMRRKGVIRTKTLKTKIADRKIKKITAIEQLSGGYCIEVIDTNNNLFYVTTYRNEAQREFKTLSAVGGYCKDIGISQSLIIYQTNKKV